MAARKKSKRRAPRSSVARLLVGCDDQPGIVAAVTNFLYHQGANIVSLDQYSTDPTGGRFFMRVSFQCPREALSEGTLETAFGDVVAERFNMTWRLTSASAKKRVAILVSKQDHALMELLWRHKRGELAADLRMVISNHPDHRQTVEDFGLPYHHVPVTRDTKPESEAAISKLLGDSIDLVILARYMQILSADFVAQYPTKIINIHHSFLPAFVGAGPYRQAHDRGVKIIGATAHYVTADLDQGPIIEQDVERVTHRHTVRDLVRIGRSIEREVLARAVRWHLDDRVLVNGNKTVVLG